MFVLYIFGALVIAAVAAMTAHAMRIEMVPSNRQLLIGATLAVVSVAAMLWAIPALLR